MNIYTVLTTTLVMIVFAGSGSAQSKTCEGVDKKVTFEVLTSNITTKDSNTRIFLQIYIEPKRFTVDSMVALIERIKREYCEFDSIALSIFDTKKKRKLPDPPPHPLFELANPNPPRGFYEYEKQSNTAELSFQAKRDNRIFEVEIIFQQNGYCVSEELYEPENVN